MLLNDADHRHAANIAAETRIQFVEFVFHVMHEIAVDWAYLLNASGQFLLSQHCFGQLVVFHVVKDAHNHLRANVQ